MIGKYNMSFRSLGTGLISLPLLALVAHGGISSELNPWVGKSPTTKIGSKTFFDIAAGDEQQRLFGKVDPDLSNWGPVREVEFRRLHTGYYFSECYHPGCTSQRRPPAHWYVSYQGDVRVSFYQAYLSDKNVVTYCRIQIDPRSYAPQDWTCYGSPSGKMPNGSPVNIADQIYTNWDQLDYASRSPSSSKRGCRMVVVGRDLYGKPVFGCQ